MNCPVVAQTADGNMVGRCCCHLPDGVTCPRHGDVSEEVQEFVSTGHLTLENVMRKRKGLVQLGKEEQSET
jgi:hypothetical protein